MDRRFPLILPVILAFFALAADQTPAPARAAEPGSAWDDSLRTLYAAFLTDADLKQGKLSPDSGLWDHWTCTEQRACLAWLSGQRLERFRRADIEIRIDEELVAEYRDGVSVFFGAPVTVEHETVIEFGRAAVTPVGSAGPDSARDSADVAGGKERKSPAATPVDELPELKSIPAPEYPLEAREAGTSGLVSLRLLVSRRGRVSSIILDSGKPVFFRAAVKVAREAEFVPARHKGVPVAVWVVMPVRFTMR